MELEARTFPSQKRKTGKSDVFKLLKLVFEVAGGNRAEELVTPAAETIGGKWPRAEE